MSDQVNWLPKGSQEVTPHLTIKGASDALAFYAHAFGAKELFRMPGPDGAIVHSELMIGASKFYVTDEMPMTCSKSPATLGGSSVTISLYLQDVDATFDRAIAAGAEAVRPPADEFWGDRFAQIVDPFGHRWSLAQHIEDVSPQEMERRMAAMFQPA